ncbi:Uncharacterized protein dnm_042570 [Desulfonema magnum]|uniref:Uncharacterized protein n=1 Tax=Desulfonema magnum TaxID=45655 RepID=A0A975GNW8_9BACT|nr:Uncharacterized protein dnm_042570 [Desulfonema magnum]
MKIFFRDMKSHNPSWGEITVKMAELFMLKMLLITPHGEK